MEVLTERSEHRPLGIFDVRDRYLERQRGDGLAVTVSGYVRFAVTAVVTADGRVEPPNWVLDTRPTLSGLSVFLDRVVETGPQRTIRKLSPAANSVELRVSSPTFQPKDVTFQPASSTNRRSVLVELAPAVDYPFERIATRPDQQGPTLIRGAVRDESGRGVPGTVVVQEGLYAYRTDLSGTWVIVLPDDLAWVQVPVGNLTVEGRRVEVEVTLTPSATWQTADVLPDPGGGVSWNRNGLVLTRTITAARGATASVPDLRLRLS